MKQLPNIISKSLKKYQFKKNFTRRYKDPMQNVTDKWHKGA